jgi:hypothetical protein
LIARVNGLKGAGDAAYLDLLEKLNGNREMVTPSKPAGCGAY